MKPGIGILLTAALLTGSASAEEPKFDRPPEWLRKPTSDQLLAVWPRDALRRGDSGKGVILCIVTETGALSDCRIKEETPPGEGFGAAALALIPQLQMRPAYKDGKPVRGAKVSIPIVFSNQTGGNAGFASQDVKVLNGGVWLRTPTRAEMAAVYPKGAAKRGLEGRSSIRCEIASNGALDQCQVGLTSPLSEGFESAARRLASKFHSATSLPDGTSIVHALVTIPIRFDPQLMTPGGADAAPIVRQPEWIRSPTMEDALRLFPARAKTAGALFGKAMVDCTVAPDGALTGCTAASEEPGGLGFGPAAVALASGMSMSPWSADGEPTAGARIRMPVVFDLRNEQAAAPAPAQR